MINSIQNPTGSSDTQTVETSPLPESALAAQVSGSTSMVLLRGVRTAEVFTSPSEELSAMLGGSAVFDLGWRSFIRCSGRDRVRWLNNMVTNSIKTLEESRGCYAFVLNAQGRIQGDLDVYRPAARETESFILQTDARQVNALMAFWRRYIIMDQVALDPMPEWTALGFAGPDAAKTLAALNLPVPPQPGISLAEAEWQGTDVVTVSGFSPLVPRYEVWIKAAAVHRLWLAALEATAVRCGAAALEQLRILEGTPAYGIDIGDRDLPQETNQTRALNFNKGCYLGQEIVERIRSRGSVHRSFTGFVLQGDAPQARTPIEVEGKAMGEITSAARIELPSGKRTFALGYIRREAMETQGSLLADGQPVELAALPFDVGLTAGRS